MEIRKVTIEEKDIALSIYRSLIGSPGCTWSEEYPADEHVTEDILNNALYGLYVDGKSTAVAAANYEEDYSELNTLYGNLNRPCALSRVGVRREYQGQGLAKRLLLYIEKDLSTRGFDGIHLLVSKTNPKAIGLYESLSYKRLGEAYMYDLHWFYYQKKFV
jgi:GNAT superfamily N-acetyltransferase